MTTMMDDDDGRDDHDNDDEDHDDDHDDAGDDGRDDDDDSDDGGDDDDNDSDGGDNDYVPRANQSPGKTPQRETLRRRQEREFHRGERRPRGQTRNIPTPKLVRGEERRGGERGGEEGEEEEAPQSSTEKLRDGIRAALSIIVPYKNQWPHVRTDVSE